MQVHCVIGPMGCSMYCMFHNPWAYVMHSELALLSCRGIKQVFHDVNPVGLSVTEIDNAAKTLHRTAEADYDRDVTDIIRSGVQKVWCGIRHLVDNDSINDEDSSLVFLQSIGPFHFEASRHHKLRATPDSMAVLNSIQLFNKSGGPGHKHSNKDSVRPCVLEIRCSGAHSTYAPFLH